MLTAALSSATPSQPIIPSSDDLGRTSLQATAESLPHIRIVPHLVSSRSLVFAVVERHVDAGDIIKIGRFTDKSMSPARITFKSKVVSRSHAELWAENGKFYIRDTKSSSGTFINHIRLSPPNHESRPHELKDGDIVQLGVDYQGGTEEIYRCVNMRLEINRKKERDTFSLNTFQSLRNLTTPPNNVSVLDAAMNGSLEEDEQRVHVEECCICLYAIAPHQALFVGPCSHTLHYKCARPLLLNHPGFLCPLCRSYADLEASVAIEADEVREMLRKGQKTEKGEVNDDDKQGQSTSDSDASDNVVQRS